MIKHNTEHQEWTEKLDYIYMIKHNTEHQEWTEKLYYIHD